MFRLVRLYIYIYTGTGSVLHTNARFPICSQLDPVPAPAFLRAVEVASQGLSDADMTQAVLEVLAVPGSGVSASDPPGLIRALFSHLDVSGEVGGGGSALLRPRASIFKYLNSSCGPVILSAHSS